MFPQGSILGPALFSLFINDLPASLPSSVSCSLYADDLAIWSSSTSVPTAVEATQEALFRLERWSEYWCLPLNPSKCEASFFSADPHQANFQPNLLFLSSRLRFNPLQLFLGSSSTSFLTLCGPINFTKFCPSGPIFFQLILVHFYLHWQFRSCVVIIPGMGLDLL